MKDDRILVCSGPIYGVGKHPSFQFDLGGELQTIMHFPDQIPNEKDASKSHHMRCMQCMENKILKETK